MRIVKKASTMQRLSLKLRAAGERIAFVPTMGALHEGHFSLVRYAHLCGSVVVVSIFVNPMQFGPREDLSRYPRQARRDYKLLRREKVDIVFAPARSEMYSPNFDTWVVPERISTILEGAHRPGHFRGVATVVLKLFNIVQPHVAIFGEKDLQQSVVIKQMVRDLNLPISIDIRPTIRDADGLALSSRNTYLSDAGRQRALVISQSLFAARTMIAEGERSAARIRSYVRRCLARDAEASVDYVSVADRRTLAELKRIEGDVAISVACRIEGVRLIDNVTMRVR